MKVKMTNLFEQSSTPEWYFEKPGSKARRVDTFSSYENIYNDNYVYVRLYKVGVDTIMLRRVKAKGLLTLDNKNIMMSDNDYENIRIAIKNFDDLLAAWGDGFGEAKHDRSLNYF